MLLDVPLVGPFNTIIATCFLDVLEKIPFRHVCYIIGIVQKCAGGSTRMDIKCYFKELTQVWL